MLDRTCNISLVCVRAQNPEPLLANAGISEITTTTSFIYMRRREGNDLKRVLEYVEFMFYSV